MSAGFVRKLADERNQPAWGLGYIFERQQPEGLPSDNTYALVGSLWYTWRRTDELLSPRRGWNAAVQLAAAPPGVSSRAFGRAVGKLAWFVPLARNLDGIVRAEAGAVLADTSSGVPQAMLFRTGGDTTVRGYAFDSLGVKAGDAVVGGRYYGLASAEMRLLGVAERRHRGIRRRGQRGRPDRATSASRSATGSAAARARRRDRCGSTWLTARTRRSSESTFRSG